ncbi:NUDIX hydrolase [Nocardia sp. BMG111209]|uniref:NUDIX hydrolase n=1 Tax=Nocardia sp. BMG111209 TaxID=1160137 RepID=UPI000476196E|nr:NUDIX domain-containing protein [Nocardia sp. BMG111209]
MARVDYYEDPDAPAANSLTVAVSAFVLDYNGRLLMIRRTDNDLYSMPGGGMEIGETVSEAVTREVHEETGISVQPTAILGIFANPKHVIAYDDGEVRQEFSICFTAHPIAGQPRTSSESKEVLWVEPADLPALNIHPSIMTRIRSGLEKRPEPYFT